MLYVTNDEKKIYTTNVTSGTVSVLEAGAVSPMGPPPGAQPGTQPGSPPAVPQGMDWNQTLIQVGKGDEGFDVSPDGRELWTANAQDGTLSVLDLERKEVTVTIDAKILASNRLKFTPDGKLVFITSLRGGDVVVYDAASRKEFKRVPVGHGAAGLLMDPVGGRVFVACTPDNYVAVIDLKTMEVTGHLDVGWRSFEANTDQLHAIVGFDQNLREVRPTIMTAVPRLFEKVYHRIVKKGLSQKGIKRKIFIRSLEIGQRYAERKPHRGGPARLLYPRGRFRAAPPVLPCINQEKHTASKSLS